MIRLLRHLDSCLRLPCAPHGASCWGATKSLAIEAVEGFIGGVGCATLLGTALWRITPFSPLQAAGMSLVTTLMAFFGGLVMAAIKRDRGVKDWGHLNEGHGGMLDRIDSVAFSAPILFHLTRYLFTP